jgi:hypothetical protein
MASGWNGTGTVILTDGTFTSTWCASTATDGTAQIKSSELDALFQCVEDSIQNCLPHDGQKAATANIPMGGFKLTGMAVGSAATDSATYGQTITALAFDSGTSVVTATRAAGDLTVDLSALAAGTGGVALTGDQTVAGVKTFSDISSLAHAKFNGPTTSKVLVPTPGASVTINAAGANAHYVTVGTNTNVTFTWPSAATDTQLSTNWTVHGKILFRHTGAGYTVTLNSTMLSNLTYYEEEGAEATGSGDLSTLVYSYWYIGGTKLAQFAWVATP